MFKKEQRYSFKKGLPKKVLKTPFYTLRFQDSTKTGFTCAVVVSKKVDRRATARNLLKRKFTTVLKEEINIQNTPFNMVFFLKKEAAEVSHDMLHEDLKKTLENLL